MTDLYRMFWILFYVHVRFLCWLLSPMLGFNNYVGFICFLSYIVFSTQIVSLCIQLSYEVTARTVRKRMITKKPQRIRQIGTSLLNKNFKKPFAPDLTVFNVFRIFHCLLIQCINQLIYRPVIWCLNTSRQLVVTVRPVNEFWIFVIHKLSKNVLPATSMLTTIEWW